MADTVRLKHVMRKNNWLFFFYNGVVQVTNGVIELPANNVTRIRRAWLMGFRLTEDGQPITSSQFSKIVAKASGRDSSEEQTSEQEDTSSGRQSRTTNRVREGESDSSGETPKRRSSGSVRSGSGRQGKRASADSGNDSEVSSES